MNIRRHSTPLTFSEERDSQSSESSSSLDLSKALGLRENDSAMAGHTLVRDISGLAHSIETNGIPAKVAKAQLFASLRHAEANNLPKSDFKRDYRGANPHSLVCVVPQVPYFP